MKLNDLPLSVEHCGRIVTRVTRLLQLIFLAQIKVWRRSRDTMFPRMWEVPWLSETTTTGY